ncbi:stage V sporulation protein B [Thermoanaerobacterium thermosaccharolyticum]|uniref:stage V sporulation protein B n=1 Tax=Thermoanaerobacterium thermosaccharolyticum TaxID=1517 RepID=UPI0012393F73|nr:stage V sporulation protein B [Thermoanaerobacterium thermosaccharolyticum]KAA5808106.1 stage V sporulation protein B [Thermoanaerobacterium thermosaccharolyticum]
MHNRSFVRGAFILTIANVIDRAIGFVFRIILSNLLGSEGTGIYQIALPIYFVAITFITSGITAVTSRFVSEERAKGNRKNIFSIMEVSFFIVIFMGVVISSVIFFNAKYISDNLLHEPRAYLSILVFTPVLIIVSSSSIFKGFFQGLINMIPASVSEIVEQIVRVSLTLYLFSILTDIKLEYAAVIAVLGIAAGEVTSFLMYIFYYRRELSYIKEEMPDEGKIWDKLDIAKTIIKTSFPITISRLIVNILDLFESLIIPSRLIKSGLTHKEAISEFGKLSGMAYPLAYMPAVITMSLSVTVLPAVSEAASLKKWDTVRLRINQAIGYTTMIAIPAIILFLTLHDEIATLLYPNSPGVGALVKIIAAGSIFAYLESIVTSILNGLGMQNMVLKNSVIWTVISVIAMYVLIPIPSLRLFGYIYGFIFADILVFILNFRELVKVTGLTVDYNNWFFKPLTSALIMSIADTIMYFNLISVIANKWIVMFITVSSGLALYLLISYIIKLPYLNDLNKLIFSRNK